eukprot:1159976-Pelagomonas_calceolata.AAC.1
MPTSLSISDILLPKGFCKALAADECKRRVWYYSMPLPNGRHVLSRSLSVSDNNCLPSGRGALSVRVRRRRLRISQSLPTNGSGRPTNPLGFFTAVLISRTTLAFVWT